MSSTTKYIFRSFTKWRKNFNQIIIFSFQDNVVGSSNAASVCSASDLENMKQEILREMKIEMNKMKQEIIEGETEC
jgi:hypothetical protein